MKMEHPFIGMAIRKCVLKFDNKDIVLCWVPSHTHVKVGVPYTDFKHCISQYIFSTWQGDWNRAVASFWQAGPGRLAVQLQAVQEG